MEIVLLVPAAIAMATLPTSRPATKWRPRRPSIPATMRGVFVSSGTASFLAFSVIGLFLSLVPTYVTKLSGSSNLALAGGRRAHARLLCDRADRGIGPPAARHSDHRPGPPGRRPGAAGRGRRCRLAGPVAGRHRHRRRRAGLAFLGGITEINRVAPKERHADVLSSFYVVIYLGVGVPVIGVGFLATVTGLLTAVQLFAAVVAALCLLDTLALARKRRELT
ncbi:hypothetical protein ACFQ3Z_07755 [Streptomyces nogalater]